MSLALDRYSELRPLLYHLTARSNLPSIREERALQSALVLASSIQPTLRRGEHRLVHRGREVVIRDQVALRFGHAKLTGGWTESMFLDALNERVFFWPGDFAGPINYGQRHRARYTEDVLLRMSFCDLIERNPLNAPYFCRFNSGAPRTVAGRKSPRGPDTFAKVCNWERPVSEVVEVSFVGSVELPDNVEVEQQGNWHPLR